MTEQQLADQLQAQYGLDRETAIRRARAFLSSSVNRRSEVPRFVSSGGENINLDAFVREVIDMVDGAPKVPLEREVQAEGVALYEKHGCIVYNLSQARASKQSEGLPDSWIFPPAGHGAGWWHEWKRPGGDRNPAQERFKRQCDESGTPYVCGGVEAAREMLRRRRIIPP